MTTVVLLVHLMIAAALVGVVLLQRSEGGALGIGGGGGAGGFLTGRGTANLLTRVTAILAAAFFVTSIVLTLLAQRSIAPRSVFDAPAGTGGATAPAQPGKEGASNGAPKAPESRGGVLDRLQRGQGQQPLPSVPNSR
jgi:preprotein translocase subunit SecG